MTISSIRTLSFSLLVSLIALVPACRHCPDVRSNVDDYARLSLAREHAMYKLIGKYGSCFPPDYGATSYFNDLQALALNRADLAVLRSPELVLDVWTELNCAGFVLVVRCEVNGTVILWDKSSTDDVLDWPSGDNTSQGPGSLPARTVPTSCSCRGASSQQPGIGG